MNVTDRFGEGAGKIWRELNSQGPLNENRLIKATELMESNFFASIGWLARENKISQYGMFYKLEETNLEEKISKNAEKIINVLQKYGELLEDYLPKILELSEQDTYIAIGWLAREGRINAEEVQPIKPQTTYHIKQ